MRGKGEGAVYRVPADPTLPLKYWTGVVELPPGPNGERRRKPVRRKNKRDLLVELAKLKADLERRGDIPTNSMTCEQWFTYWLRAAKKDVRPNTYDGYLRSVHNHIIPAIGKVKIDKLTPAHINRVQDAVLAKGLASTTALLAYRTMAVSFKMAVREGRIGVDPTSRVKPPKKATTQLEALTLSEAIHILELAADDRERGARDATYLLTGGRRGEVIGLERDRVGEVLDLSWQLQRIKWQHGCDRKCGTTAARACPQRKTDDVPADYEHRPLRGGLYWTRPKSSKGWRIVPLVDPLRSILERHLESTPPNEYGLVFTNNGQPIDPAVASRDWRTTLRASGIAKNVRLHDVRHTTVDLLYAAGVDEDIIMEIVGHSQRAQTQAYKSPQNRERLALAMQRFSAMFVAAQEQRRALTQSEPGRTPEIGA